MECNKDDAIKAMEIAKKKFNAKDIAGAKKFALKAQNLYPGLEGISQMVVTLDVYASSENQIVGEADWYGVLGVSPQADDDAVRKQYRKLALILHPDKNKSIGAEGAFKLVSQAWSMLSDKSRRAAYDAKRNPKGKNPSELFGPNGLYNFAKTASSNAKSSKNANVNVNVPRTNGSSTAGSTKKSASFWTICHRCKMQYEYLRSYLNQNLLCPTCRLPFFALEQPPPDSKSSSHHRKFHRGDSTLKSNSKGNFQWFPFSGAAGASSVSQAANVVQQTYDKVKRVREEAQAAAKKREKSMKRKNHVFENFVEKKRRASDDTGINNHQMGPKTTRMLAQIELQKILMDTAQKEIRGKLNGSKSTSFSDNSAEKVTTNEKRQCQDKSKVSETNTGSMKARASVPVPDPDFHNFDQNRTEIDFEEGQVWAVYDDVDGVPRYYAMIHRIISRNPFRVRITWLTSKNMEFNPIKRVGCGEFSVGGRRETCDGLNCFSHKVKWENDSRGSGCIFPRKGDVWAIYKNWSLDWDELTDDDVIHQYDVVEVLEDYSENIGVFVIPLVKVAGFKALFHRHLDPEKVSRVPSREISRFSHQIPSYLLSGREAPNGLKDCRELDPAALPLKYLQAIGDVKDEPIITFHDDPKPVNIVSESAETMEEVT